MTSGKPTRADARRSYERLLYAAAEVFAEQGTSAALDDIAKRAGAGNATLYRHFPTAGTSCRHCSPAATTTCARRQKTAWTPPIP
ncbi:helix-turn-helix domain-containing protein [Actinomadura sp. NPDC048394]|uniref:TetR/AcrR family transcriptional regulator n=1 Tax=Actinomadura sp. NPDC048394 TaxID=3158223 RepID=UPI0033E87163